MDKKRKSKISYKGTKSNRIKNPIPIFRVLEFESMITMHQGMTIGGKGITDNGMMDRGMMGEGQGW